MQTFDFPTDGFPADNASGRDSAAKKDWQAAGDRVLLYLRCLDVSETTAHEWTLKTLETAERGMSQGGNPVHEAVQALQQLLREQGLEVSDQYASPGDRPQGIISSYPPIQRGHMVPETGLFGPTPAKKNILKKLLLLLTRRFPLFRSRKD
ncbi:MAG: hypothetical protein K9K64_03320 [Desulfohalobiaceae bacterium]|nr:hypothetical protein [Desulfohalobiaceae bacterium]